MLMLSYYKAHIIIYSNDPWTLTTEAASAFQAHIIHVSRYTFLSYACFRTSIAGAPPASAHTAVPLTVAYSRIPESVPLSRYKDQ